jgi:hypothetical protein
MDQIIAHPCYCTPFYIWITTPQGCGYMLHGLAYDL